jgi:Na+/phosphate symporter
MLGNLKEQFLNELTKDLKLKLKQMKLEQKTYAELSGLKEIMRKTTQGDPIGDILEKLQNFTEKQLKEEIEMYEGVLLELEEINSPKNKMAC